MGVNVNYKVKRAFLVSFFILGVFGLNFETGLKKFRALAAENTKEDQSIKEIKSDYDFYHLLQLIRYT